MKILGVGVDIVENSRIDKSLKSKLFIKRIFSNSEILVANKESLVCGALVLLKEAKNNNCKIMKKLLPLILIAGFAFGANAQDKKFQIGLVLGPTFNWTKIQTTKIERNGIGNGFTIGVGGNYMFNENIGLASGIQFDLELFTLNYGDNTNTVLGDVFYAYSDTEYRDCCRRCRHQCIGSCW